VQHKPASGPKESNKAPDYFSVKMKQVEMEAEDEEEEIASDVPEHLPSSPLCPLNPKNLMYGQLLCPIHGKGSLVAGRRPSKDGRTTTFRNMLA
jgi:hypothetical protein